MINPIKFSAYTKIFNFLFISPKEVEESKIGPLFKTIVKRYQMHHGLLEYPDVQLPFDSKYRPGGYY